jgi:hypothetical protein
VYDAIETHSNVAMFAAPTMVSRLINHGKAGSTDTRGLKTLIYGGAPMSPQVARGGFGIKGLGRSFRPSNFLRWPLNSQNGLGHRT